ncbi:MAG TPA: hypothetical protein VMY39_10500, partial [Planctomycetota bacterium]|nr:hypothetical protein [Planctomycetota bacterium]
TLAVKAEDRPELMLWVDDDGKVTTGKSLLEEIREGNALGAMVECYDQLKSFENKPIPQVDWPHLDFYCEKGTLTIRGKAANGRYFESTDTDSDDFHTFFNFVPRAEAETVVLVPYMP